MFALSGISVKAKLLLVPVLAALGFVVYIAINSFTVIDTAQNLEQVRDTAFPIFQIADNNVGRLAKFRDLLQSAAATSESEMVDSAETLATQIREKINDISAIHTAEADTAARLRQLFDRYAQQGLSLSRGMISGEIDFARVPAMAEDMAAAQETAEQAFTALRDHYHQQVVDTIDQANQRSQSALFVGLGVGSVTLALIIAVAIPVTRSIQRNLTSVIESLRDMAQGSGDLTVRLEKKTNDEIGELVAWFNQLMEKLHDVVRQIAEVAHPLSKLGADISEITEVSYREIDQQRSGNQAAKDAVEHIERSINDAAQSAGNAAASAREAEAEARSGNQIAEETIHNIQMLASDVSQAREVINKLEEDARDVGMVVDVIKSIAEQTNLLALNAAIEAARAGEQGRGFAVVADEVRSLASKTQESTEEIHTIIVRLQEAAHSAVQVMDKGNTEANQSVEQVGTTGESLARIKDTVENISAMNQQIADATDSQRQLAGEIVHNVVTANDLMTNTSERAHSLAESGHQLADLATALDKITRQFRIEPKKDTGK